jgi:hypothetical protein
LSPMPPPVRSGVVLTISRSIYAMIRLAIAK